MTGRRFQPDFLQELFANPLDPGYADAAARRAEHGPRPLWRRRSALGLRIVSLAAIGFLLAVAYRHAVAAEPERNVAHAGLVDEVKAAQERSDAREAQADTLRGEVRRLQETALGGVTDQLRQIREQEAVTGLARVTGDGMIVRLADAPAPVDPTTGRPSGDGTTRILDVDLQNVVNGLWSSGAEAIAVNGQRLTSTSTIRTAGNAILVDFRPVTSPYEVAAIGPGDIEERFGATPAAATMRGLAAEYGLQFQTRTEESLTLAAAIEAPLRHAQPLHAQTSSEGQTPSAKPTGSPR
jgi:uncharacterized protein YlxW (UPF0749 family)